LPAILGLIAFMKAIQRLFQYFEFKHIKPTRLERDLGLGKGYLGLQLKREADIGSSILEKYSTIVVI